MKRSIGAILDNVITESMKGDLYQIKLSEKEKQDQTSQDLNLFSDEEDSESEEEVSSSKTVDDDSDDVDEVPEIEEIIEKLNIIRSGRSLKDEEVNARFNEYYGSLSEPEKIALFVYLKGIGQVIAGDVGGEEAIDPGDHPVPVEIKPDVSNKQAKSIKPNVIREPSPPETKKTSSGEEDTSPPVPIKPVKK